MTRTLTSLAVRSDRILLRLFRRAASGLPWRHHRRQTAGPASHARLHTPDPRRRNTVGSALAAEGSSGRSDGARYRESRLAHAGFAAVAPNSARYRGAAHKVHRLANSRRWHRTTPRRRRDHLQSSQGYWSFEWSGLYHPAEYVLMMHFLQEIELPEAKLAAYLRTRQAEHALPLYHVASST